MSDLTERLLAYHKHNTSSTFYGTDTINPDGPEAAEALTAKDAEIEKLKTAIRLQAAAVRTLEANKSTELNVLRARAQGEYAATRTLDSEKDMNAILTAESEAKDAEIARLREENAALRDRAANSIQWAGGQSPIRSTSGGAASSTRPPSPRSQP